ncbi:hypothetical protein BaRGS_00026006 [Batillaria attramentaria]|uniref:Uncharacterized protein n=1 Tax=Batillaria attramentaria TaxID=370345 RepID=A0ABD0K748_9CAEN
MGEKQNNCEQVRVKFRKYDSRGDYSRRTVTTTPAAMKPSSAMTQQMKNNRCVDFPSSESRDMPTPLFFPFSSTTITLWAECPSVRVVKTTGVVCRS